MLPNLPEALFDLTNWDQLSEQACKQLAQHVAVHLPAPFRFTSLDTYEIGTRRRHVAFFTWQADVKQTPRLFSLIPGGSVTLGFDRAHPFVAERNLVIDWQQYWLFPRDAQRVDRSKLAAQREKRHLMRKNVIFFQKGASPAMRVNECIEVQTSPEARFSIPPWFAEVVIVAQYLATQGLFDVLGQQVRFVRGHFGKYEPLEFIEMCQILLCVWYLHPQVSR